MFRRRTLIEKEMMGRRTRFIALAVATIVLGLLVHLRGAILGSETRDVLGDALWAAMIAWGVGALMLRARLAVRSAIAYVICVSVEVSQLYHASTLDAIRTTQLGHLVLGSGFDPRDLVAYAGGIVGAALIEAAVVPRGRGPRDAI